MKRATRRLIVTGLISLLAVNLWGSPTPQPRLRLQREAAGKATVVEEKTDSSESTAVLEKVTVTDTKIPTPPKPLQEYTGKTFSILEGGPLYEKSGKRLSVSFGLWHHGDEFAEDARFKPGATHAEFSLLRIKW